MTTHCGYPKKPIRFFKVTDYGSFHKQLKTPMTSHCGRRQKLTCFFKVMDYGSFENQLSIPKKFVESFKEEELRGWWTLIGPSRNQWRVKIKRVGEETYFSHAHGWPVFVRDHNIKPADLLRFSYARKSTFHVFVFDESGCQRESAHFAVNTSALPSPVICPSSLHPTGPDHDVDEDEDTSVEIIGTSNSRARRINTEGEYEASSNRKTTTPSTHTQGNERSKQSSCVTNKKNEGRRGGGEYITMANSFMVENEHTGMPMFKLTMLPCHLNYSMAIPKPWAVKNMLRRDHLDVKLKVPGVERTWTLESRWVRGGCKFRRGWRNFLVDNEIEEHDICVFQLAQKGEDGGDDGTNKSAIINVHIFHARG